MLHCRKLWRLLRASSTVANQEAVNQSWETCVTTMLTDVSEMTITYHRLLTVDETTVGMLYAAVRSTRTHARNTRIFRQQRRRVAYVSAGAAGMMNNNSPIHRYNTVKMIQNSMWHVELRLRQDDQEVKTVSGRWRKVATASHVISYQRG